MQGWRVVGRNTEIPMTRLTFAKALLVPVFLVAATAAWAYDLNTPIQTLAAQPAAAAVLNKDIPGLLTNDNYGIFKVMSLKQVGVLSGGKLDKQTLAQTESDLRALHTTNGAVQKIAY
jgi:hypothetical protein